MKTQSRLACESERERQFAALITRWYRLRKTRPELVPALLQEGAHLWTFTDACDPWGSREALAFDDFARLVDGAESLMHDVRVAA